MVFKATSSEGKVARKGLVYQLFKRRYPQWIYLIVLVIYASLLYLYFWLEWKGIL